MSPWVRLQRSVLQRHLRPYAHCRIQDHLRIGCDLVNLLFVIDEYTDPQNIDSVRSITNIIMDAFHGPEKARPSEEAIIGELARSSVLQGI